MPKFGRKVPTLDASFKIKRSVIGAVIKPINFDTHCVPHHPNAKTDELQTWYTGAERRPGKVDLYSD